MPCKLTVTARNIFPLPHKAQIVSEGESQGRHLDTGVDLLVNTIDGSRTTNSLASWTVTTTSATDLVRSRSVRIDFEKKNWSPTCPLNGSFQSPNCPLKEFFTRQTGYFIIVANGRMAADFSIPAFGILIGPPGRLFAVPKHPGTSWYFHPFSLLHGRCSAPGVPRLPDPPGKQAGHEMAETLFCH